MVKVVIMGILLSSILLTGCVKKELEPVAMDMYQPNQSDVEYIGGGMIEVTADMLK